jgi:hypothetical protein
MNSNKKEMQQIIKQLDTLSISSDSDNSIFSNLTNYQHITTKKHEFLVGHIIDSLKLNNANLALEIKMLSESLEQYKKNILRFSK